MSNPFMPTILPKSTEKENAPVKFLITIYNLGFFVKKDMNILDAIPIVLNLESLLNAIERNNGRSKQT